MLLNDDDYLILRIFPSKRGNNKYQLYIPFKAHETCDISSDKPVIVAIKKRKD